MASIKMTHDSHDDSRGGISGGVERKKRSGGLAADKRKKGTGKRMVSDAMRLSAKSVRRQKGSRRGKR